MKLVVDAKKIAVCHMYPALNNYTYIHRSCESCVSHVHSTNMCSNRVVHKKGVWYKYFRLAIPHRQICFVMCRGFRINEQ